MPVVERDVGRRADDDEDPSAIEAELVQHRLVGLEAGEVVLLLEPGEAPDLAGARAEAVEARLGDRLRDDDAAGRDCRGGRS